MQGARLPGPPAMANAKAPGPCGCRGSGLQGQPAGGLMPGSISMSETPATSAYSKDNPFPAVVTENRLLSRPGSEKETRHIVVSIAGSGLHYKSGDSIGIFATNRPSEVDAILGHLGADGSELVTPARTPAPLQL